MSSNTPVSYASNVKLFALQFALFLVVFQILQIWYEICHYNNQKTISKQVMLSFNCPKYKCNICIQNRLSYFEKEIIFSAVYYSF